MHYLEWIAYWKLHRHMKHIKTLQILDDDERGRVCDCDVLA